jgi:hypothetical protein
MSRRSAPKPATPSGLPRDRLDGSHGPGDHPGLEQRLLRDRLAGRRAMWAYRRARRRRKSGTNFQDAADIGGSSQVRGGFFTTDPGPRP